MPRPSPWNSPTKAIRVPEHATEACLQLARMLDQDSPEVLYKTEPLLVTIDDRRYLMPPQAITPEQAAWANDLIDQVLATAELGKDAEALLLSELAPRILSPL